MRCVRRGASPRSVGKRTRWTFCRVTPNTTNTHCAYNRIMLRVDFNAKSLLLLLLLWGQRPTFSIWVPKLFLLAGRRLGNSIQVSVLLIHSFSGRMARCLPCCGWQIREELAVGGGALCCCRATHRRNGNRCFKWLKVALLLVWMRGQDYGREWIIEKDDASRSAGRGGSGSGNWWVCLCCCGFLELGRIRIEMSVVNIIRHYHCYPCAD